MSRPSDPSPPGLTTTSYAVLAQLALRPWSTYELAQQRVRYVWPRAESAIYREVKRLDAMGLVAAKREYVGKRPRTVYSITDAGRQVLREWLDTPVSPFAMDFEAMIRLFVAPLGTKEQIITTLEQVRDDAQEMLAFGGAVKQEFLDGRATLQDQVYIRAHAVDFFISLLTTVDDWAERTLAEIQGWEDLSPDGKNDRGLQIMAQLPAPTPGEPTDRTPMPPRTQRRRRWSSGSSKHALSQLPSTFRAAGERPAKER
jgi:PadR family transcriptional regulator AphA